MLGACMDSLTITPQDLELDFDVNELPSVAEMIALVESYTGIAITSHAGIAKTSAPISAKNTLFSQKISIRIPHYVLTDIKHKANEMGLPYQTLTNIILNEYVAGKLKF